MSVLIKGMEMPSACVFCELYDGDFYWCRGAKKEVPYRQDDKRAKFCPLVPVLPHGRLIDADALGADLLYDAELCARALGSGDIVDSKEAEDLQWEKDCKQNCAYYLTNAETIIEAEEGET